jgi:ankyrin repeat protein
MTTDEPDGVRLSALRTFERGRRDALDLLKTFRNGNASAIERVSRAARASEHVRKTQRSDNPDEAVIGHPYDAVQVIAHEQNGSSWAAMCIADINHDALTLNPEHPFIRALVQNDLTEVRHHLDADAQLANARISGSAWNLDGMIYEAWADGPTKTSDGDERTTTPLHHAAVRKGKAELAQILIDYGADVDALGFQPNCDISPPIRLAAWEGDLETMRVLLEVGADPDLGGGSLFSALEHGRRDKAELMLRHGGSHDIFTAAMYGDEKVVRDFVRGNPELVHERSPSRNRTPIEEAINLGQLDVARVLIELGSDILPETAAALGRIEDIRQLIETNPDVLHALYGTQPLICWATIAGQAATIDFLIEHGADPNQPDQWDVTPLRMAPTAEVVDHLVEGGADVNLESRGMTPLAAQLSASNLDVAEGLLRNGADPNRRSGRRGRTPYHFVLGGDRDIERCLRFLLEHGADPTAPDASGQTPLEFVTEQENDEAVRILRESIQGLSD